MAGMPPGHSLWRVSLIQFFRFRALWCVGPLALFSILQWHKMAQWLQTWTKVLLFIPRSQASWLVALTMVSCKFGDSALRPLIFVQCKSRVSLKILMKQIRTYQLRLRWSLNNITCWVGKVYGDLWCMTSDFLPALAAKEHRLWGAGPTCCFLLYWRLFAPRGAVMKFQVSVTQPTSQLHQVTGTRLGDRN